MLPLNKEQKSLIDAVSKPEQTFNLAEDDTIKVGMNFEDRFVVIELNDDKTTMLSLPMATAYQLGLKLLEATSIINFANSVGIQFTDQEV